MRDEPGYRFGRFELRPRQRVLLRDGRAYALGGRAFDVLVVLVENQHRVVHTRELIERVWQGLAVEPNNLQVQIWVLRRLLGRDAILTVPRRGYRFLAPPRADAAVRPGDDPLSPVADAAGADDADDRPADPAAPCDGASEPARLRWRSRL